MHWTDLSGCEAATQEKSTLLVFTAEWCPACDQFCTMLSKLESDPLFPRVVLMDVDEDRQGAIEQFKLKLLPTVLYFKSGELISRTEGLTSSETIQGMLRPYEP